MSGWRPALRIAWRDALRARGRTALAVIMIALPVLAVSAAAVVLKTSEVSGAESADRLMGSSEAFVWIYDGGPVVQPPDPTTYGAMSVGDTDDSTPTTEAEIRAVLGEDVELIPKASGWSALRIDDRRVHFKFTGVDLRDPLADGLFDLEAGRLPEVPGEVVVNEAMLAKGLAVGDDIEVLGQAMSVVGSGLDATWSKTPTVIGPDAAAAGSREDGSLDRVGWLVGGDPVTWPEVLELNQLGGVVASRAVLNDPPDVASIAEQMGYDTSRDEMIAVVVMIVVMALLEVILLAGPAFAVGARRQSRALALIAASGGTPAQARRVVLAGGIVIGLLSAGVGLVLGVAAGVSLTPLVQRWSDQRFGPLEVPWLWLLAIGAFGLLAAFLAAVVPAWIASRHDVVAVLAGRRGDRSPRASTPVLGLVLLGIGMAGSAYGAGAIDRGNGAFAMAASAVVAVIGMILVVPIVVASVARLGRRLPLHLRFAARDAARHRTRTVPAVAAVAATVAGVVALGIANASDEHENEATYTPQLAMGDGRISWWPGIDAVPGEEEVADPEAVWTELAHTARTTAPEVDVTHVRGMVEEYDDGGWRHLTFAEPGSTEVPLLSGYGGSFNSSVLVATDARASGLASESARQEADAALAAGRAVVFTSRPTEATEAEAVVETIPGDGEMTSSPAQLIPATYVQISDRYAPGAGLLPPELAAELGLETATVGLLLQGDLDRDTQTRIEEAVGGMEADSSVYVERGYQRPDEATIVLLVLFSLGAVLMLGGTLTATFLALSDARPDLATLAAVGAAPRTRRGVAASYALVVGFVGAVLGAAVGFIPGIAISRPLTTMGAVLTIEGSGTAFGEPQGSGPYLDIPWLMIMALVVLLPLLTAAVVGLSARSRLPMVTRLD